MTLAGNFAEPRSRQANRSRLLLWGSAVAAVLALHVLVAWLATGWQPMAAMPNQPSPSVLVDLPPPPTPEQVQPAPRIDPVRPDPTPKATEKPQEQEQPEAKGATPEISSEPRMKLPDLPSMDWTKTVLATPKVEEQKRASGSSSPASWKRALVAHIGRFLRYPQGIIVSGTATVVFVVSPSGQVLSAKLVSSSGDPALDRETVASIYRASPVPPPPGASGNVTVDHSIRFGP